MKRTRLVRMDCLGLALILLFSASPLLKAVGDRPTTASWNRPEEEIEFRRKHAPIVTSRITGEDSRGFQITWYYVDGSVAAIVQRESEGEGGNLTTYIEPGSCKPLSEVLDDLIEVTLPLEVETALYFPSQVHQLWVTGLVDEYYVKFTIPSPHADDYAYWDKQQPRLHKLAEQLARLKTVVLNDCSP